MQIKLGEELRHLNLGDKRRNERFETIVKRIVNQPGMSIPQLGYSWSDIKMTYDFYNNDKVLEDQVSSCIQKATVDRCLHTPVVLSVQDTTSINFNSSAEGLGYLEHGMGEGLMVHNTLALDEQGCPLGILYQKIWARDKEEMGKKKTRHKRAIEDKESYRWIESMRKTEELLKQENPLKESPKIVHIADREADVYELFSEPRTTNSELLIRCSHDRKTLLGNSMWQEIETEQVLATFELELPAANSEAMHGVQMEVRSAMVLLSPPVTKNKLPALMLYGILVREVNELKNGLEWRIITTMPATTTEQALTFVKWYSYRWRVERFHYILKSGCRLEDLQLRKVNALRKAIIVYSLCAFKLMQLLYQARLNPEESCSIYLHQEEWQLLVSLHGKSPVVNRQAPTLQQSVIMIARLGGYLARNNDGPPGIKNLWRGLQQLNAMVKAINLKNQWFSTS
jgi:hypothetical protein